MCCVHTSVECWYELMLESRNDISWQTNKLTCLEIVGSLYKLDDPTHPIRRAFGAKLSQDDRQNGMMIAGQEVVIHTLTYTRVQFCIQ